MGPLYQHEKEVASKMAILFDEAADGIGMVYYCEDSNDMKNSFTAYTTALLTMNCIKIRLSLNLKPL